MRRRAALAAILAVLTAGALAAGTVEASASVKSAKAPLCAGKTKKAAIAAIKDAYDFFLDGAKHPDSKDKESRIQYMSGKHTSPGLISSFEVSAAKNAGAAATTNVAVHKVTCKGKKAAEVQAELVLGGSEAPGIFPNPGKAVLDGKVWKVSAETLCNLQGVGDATILEQGACADIVGGSPPSDLT